MMRPTVTRAMLALLAAAVCAAAARVQLESYASGMDTVPLAVVPFRALRGQPLAKDEPWKVIAADLAFSPRFRALLAPKADSAVFAGQGIGIYVDGEYAVEAGAITMDCYLRDAASGETLLGRRYKGDPAQVRSMAHRFSNQIVESLFGERGIFESRILFVRSEGRTKELYIMDYDGRGVKRLTRTGTINIFPAFLDSSSIVWVSFLRGKPDIYRGSIASGQAQPLIYSRSVQTSPAVDPVSGRIAYACSKPGNLEIYVAAADGTNQQQLTFRGGIDTSPCWSPSGYQIAFTSDRSGQPQIYVMDSDGTNTRRLTFEGSYQDSPAWSPRGDRIAYASYQNGKFDVWTVGADGTDARRITSMPGNNEYPSWSPDGLHIVFVSRSGGASDLYAVRADGSGARRLTDTGDAGMPEWERR